MSQWGFFLTHIGTVILLTGGLVGNLFGFKGTIDIHEGQTAKTVKVLNKKEKSVAQVPLGFGLRLDDFEVVNYPPEYRFYVYTKKGNSYKIKESLKMKEVSDFTPTGVQGCEFRVTRIIPGNRADEKTLARSHEMPKALEVDLAAGGEKQTVKLQAGGALSAVRLPGGTALRYVWQKPDESFLNARRPAPAAHTLLFKSDASVKNAEEIAVLPGGSFSDSSGQYLVQVLKYIPDFIYDMKTRQAASRSLESNNPALLIAYRKKGSDSANKRWLFARMPDYGQQHGKKNEGPEFVYRFDSAKAPAEREVVVSGKAGLAWVIENGEVREPEPLASAGGALPALKGVHYRFVQAPKEKPNPHATHQDASAPTAELELRVGGETHKHRLAAARPVPIVLPDGKSLLTFQKKPEEVKAYKSRLTVIDGGKEKLSQLVVVNAPLNYGGFAFYQSNYRKDDPTYSGLQVVKDPGLPLVWLGFCMVSLGVIFCFYVRPVVMERSKK